MKKSLYFVIIIILFLIGLLIGYTTTSKLIVEKEFPVNATCGNFEGINIEREPVLQFGIITSGSEHFRKLNITNSGDQAARIETSVTGAIKDYMTVDSPKTINPMETANIKLTIKCPNRPKGSKEIPLPGIVTVSLYK
jgi:uncharacterized membrane protein